MEVWKEHVMRDIQELKSDQKHIQSNQETMQKEIQELKVSDKLQDTKIRNIEATLTDIKSDTSWIRRKITGALITALITAVIAGVVGIAIANIFGGGS